MRFLSLLGAVNTNTVKLPAYLSTQEASRVWKTKPHADCNLLIVEPYTMFASSKCQRSEGKQVLGRIFDLLYRNEVNVKWVFLLQLSGTAV